ncbi:MAG: ferredoxin [bacterium]
MKVTVIEDKCIGCGVCVNSCPEVFEMDEETNKAIILEDADFDSCDLDEAIDNCPTDAIEEVD